ncbi:ATP-binding protein [Acidithiobacillus ferrooxidans]|uniref:ATP-binding protein n=1 Tax=Acidithiobacillus ferrooxidans TaxID=920 RepID=UPI000A5143C6
MNPNATARLPLMFTDLRLPTMKRVWQELAERSNQEGWPAERFLASLLEQEILGREERRLERRRQESNLSPDKRLGSYVRIPAIVGSDSADRGHPRKAYILVTAILCSGGHDASTFGVS